MKIAVVCGGLSNERDVSLSSGTGIARALRGQGHQVALADLFLGLPEAPADIGELFTAEDRGLGQAVAETTGLYGLVIALLLLFVKPLLP